jgi:hypothetical protein
MKNLRAKDKKMSEIFIDLHTDWANILRSQLAERGFSVPANSNNDDVCIMYFNLLKRSVKEKPRKVLESTEFFCPPEIMERYNKLKENLEAGKSIKAHLSRQLSDLKYNDPMLNDWAIYHLHLSSTIDPDGFVNRASSDPLNDYLLYARFDDENAYLINIYKHGAWAKQEMIRILHRNWTESIKFYKLDGVVEMQFTSTDDDIKELRKSKINTFVEVEKGIVYMPLGWGSSGDGTSSEIVMAYNRYLHSIKRIEKGVKDQIVKISDKIAEIGKPIPDKFIFQLVIDGNDFYVKEISTGVIFKM